MLQPIATSVTNSMDSLRANYEAARETRFTQRPSGMPVAGVSADYHLRNERDFWYMLEFHRHIEMNDPCVPQGVSRFVSNVIQGGFTMKPETGVDWLDRYQTERWEQFSDPDNRQNVDFAMQQSWHDIEKIGTRRMIYDGDFGLNPLADGRLQILEAHNIRSPLFGQRGSLRRNNKVFLGVEKNNSKQITRYWLHPDEDTVMTARNKPHGVNAWEFDDLTGRNEPNFFHCFLPERFNQSRGLGVFAPVLQTIGMHGDAQFATLVKQQMASFIGLIHKVPHNNDQEYNVPDYGMTTCPYTGRQVPRGPELTPGAEFWPRYKGEEISAFQANIPSTEFFEHSRLLLTFISLRLGMPLILFLLDANETNFSAWRGALDQAKLQFMQFQQGVASKLHAPVWRWKMRRFIRSDAKLRKAYQILGEDALRSSWGCPGWPYIEPLKDAQADATEIGANLNSPRRVAARRQLSYDKIIQETVEDREKLITLAIQAAERINKLPYIIANPDEKATWREVSHPVMPDGLQMQILDKNQQSSDERKTESPATSKPTQYLPNFGVHA